MPLYSLNGETASIMTLAPVIPVLTVTSVEDGVGQARALVAGGLYAIEVTLRTPPALAAIREIAKSVPGAVVVPADDGLDLGEGGERLGGVDRQAHRLGELHAFERVGVPPRWPT